MNLQGQSLGMADEFDLISKPESFFENLLASRTLIRKQ